jgi:dCMP deaminase
MQRPTWDEYFIRIAELTSERSNCIKRKVGCIIVKENRILSLGYNGTPSKMKNCYEGGCKRCFEQFQTNENISGKNLDLCMCLHAEENAMLFLSKSDLIDSVLYVTLIPCISCVKKIIQCGIKKVIYLQDYNIDLTELSLNMLNETGIIVEKIERKLPSSF